MMHLLRTAGRLLSQFANRALLSQLENVASMLVNIPEATPIFIVGPPRSGTTLAYQLVAARFDVGYLSNCGCSLFGFPALAGPSNSGPPKRLCEYQSDLGNTRGASEPSECGEYWYRFFPRTSGVIARSDMSRENEVALRRSLAMLQRCQSRPVLLKNVFNSMRVAVLGRIFPRALFVVMKRDRTKTARSIVSARLRKFGDGPGWFSVKPAQWEKLDSAPYIKQGEWQIDATYSAIESQIDEANLRSRVYYMSYERLLSDEIAELEKLAQFFDKNLRLSASVFEKA